MKTKKPFEFMTKLALGLAVFAASGLAQAQDVITQSDGKQCGLSGTAKSASAKALDSKKNRYVAPGAADIDPNVSMAAMLAPSGDSGDAGRFDDSRGATVTGFVVNVKLGGTETCNCGATGAVDRDTHIELGLSAGAPENQRVIVEVTPRLRAKMAQQGVDWSSATLAGNGAGGIKGKWVEVTGWLLFDSMHVGNAENTNPGNPKNWRATCWEIHPITDIRIVGASPDQPPGNALVLHPDVLKAFHAVRTKESTKSGGQAKLAKQNRKTIRKFDPSELENEEMAEDIQP
jgi:hypothetical protein